MKSTKEKTQKTTDADDVQRILRSAPTLSDVLKPEGNEPIIDTLSIDSISKDVWHNHIFPCMDIASIKSLSASCKQLNQFARLWIREHHYWMSNRTTNFDRHQLWISPRGIFAYDKIDLDAIDQDGLPTIESLPVFPTVKHFTLPVRKYPAFRFHQPVSGPQYKALPREMLPLRLLRCMPDLTFMQLPLLSDESIGSQVWAFNGFEFTKLCVFSETQFYVCDKSRSIYLLDIENNTIMKQAQLEANKSVERMKIKHACLFAMDTRGITQWSIEAEGGPTLKRLARFIVPASDFELLQNGTRLIVIENSAYQCIRIFDTQSGKHLKKIETPRIHMHLIKKIDEMSVLLSTREGNIYYYHLLENAGIRAKRECDTPLDSTRKYFITCRGENIRLFNRKTKSCMGLLATDSTMYQQCVAITPVGRIIHMESRSPFQAPQSSISVYQPIDELLKTCEYDFTRFSLSEATLTISKNCVVKLSSPAFYDIKLSFSPEQDPLFIRFIDHLMRAIIAGYELNNEKVERYSFHHHSVIVKAIQSEFLEAFVSFFQYFWQRFGNESDLIVRGMPEAEYTYEQRACDAKFEESGTRCTIS